MYALLAVEVAPGKIAYFHLELDRTPGACTIDLDRSEPDPITPLDVLSPYAYGPSHLTATLSGTVVSDRPDYRGTVRTEAVSPAALTAGSAE